MNSGFEGQKICVLGLGYVGLPLAVEFAKRHRVIGLDIDAGKIEELRKSHDRMREVTTEELAGVHIDYTTDPARMHEADYISSACRHRSSSTTTRISRSSVKRARWTARTWLLAAPSSTSPPSIPASPRTSACRAWCRNPVCSAPATSPSVTARSAATRATTSTPFRTSSRSSPVVTRAPPIASPPSMAASSAPACTGRPTSAPPRRKRSSRTCSVIGLSVIDIGCGGGLVAEPLARLGAAVTGIDPAPENVEAAKAHAKGAGLDIDYRPITAEALALEGGTFDAVLLLEVVEHVPDVPLFLKSVASLVKPGGVMVLSTLNRTLKAYALAIVGAELILRWLPAGTHDWNRFVTPEELRDALARAGLTVSDLTGMVYHPFADEWLLSRDTDVNYFATALRPD